MNKVDLRILTLALALSLIACNRNSYEVVERSETVVSNFQAAGTHSQVNYVLLRGGHKIYATCDAYEIGSQDPSARCSFRPLHTYRCVLGDDRIEKASFPMADLKCVDSDGHNVYLYVDKKE